MDLIDHQQGGYRFLPAIAPYSSGVVAMPEYEIEHVILQQPLVLETGFQRIDTYLVERGRPKTALCAVQLRSPQPFSFGGFSDFNDRYQKLLRARQLHVDETNPIARTNVAPEVDGPPEPSVFAFSLTVPNGDASAPPSFIVSGGGEVVDGALSPDAIVRRGDVSPDGLIEKAGFVMDEMLSRLAGLGVTTTDVTVVDVYTVHSIHSILASVLLPRMGPTSVHGIHWYQAKPPVREIEFEMDMRGVRREVRLIDGGGSGA